MNRLAGTKASYGANWSNLAELQINSLIEKHKSQNLYLCLTPYNLVNRISEIRDWMAQKRTKQWVWLLENRQKKGNLISHLSVHSLRYTTSAAKNYLGVIFHSSSNFKSNFRNNAKEKLIHAFVYTRPDYCKAPFTGHPKNLIEHLQLVQHTTARILNKNKLSAHITCILKSLQLLLAYCIMAWQVWTVRQNYLVSWYVSLFFFSGTLSVVQLPILFEKRTLQN